MARNLYDIEDRNPDRDRRWLHEKQERPARIVPVRLLLVAFAIAGLAVFLLKDALPGGGNSAAGNTPTSINASFTACDDPNGDACVLTANSYAYEGRRYRLSDIRVPAEDGARCPEEAEKAQRGRMALLALLNGGRFDAKPDPTDADPAARRLTRDEVSLGEIMILKGHASPWSAAPIDWCAA